MDLKKAADYFDKELFATYDSAAQTWTEDDFKGRMMPVDRFLSNFSRPLHRRMLICSPDEVIPDSGTLRSSATNEIYLIGQVRFDAYANNPYQALYMAHLVSGLNGGVGVVTKRSAVGPSNDPGHLVKATVGSYYMDLELRATTPEEGTEHQVAGQYFAMAPPECNLDEWDYIALNGKNYRVKEGYFDSGLRFARVLQTEDDRVDFVYHKITGFSYSTASGTPTPVVQDYNVTGAIHEFKRIADDTDRVSENTFKLIIASEHTGFPPSPRESVRIDEEDHTILRVDRDPLTSEWTLICQA